MSDTSFRCYVGLRQGESLSPLLFAMYLNDFENFMSTVYKGLSHISAEAIKCMPDENLDVYLKLYLLLHADDTIIMSENATELQLALDGLYIYCNDWNLTVNTSKTKVVIFSKGKVL